LSEQCGHPSGRTLWIVINPRSMAELSSFYLLFFPWNAIRNATEKIE
jgi:hypothetical protein